MANQMATMLSTLLQFTSLTMNNTTNNTVTEGKCYGIYGCFRNDMEWTSAGRPFTLYPQTESEIDLRYAVFNDHNRSYPYFLDSLFLDAELEDLQSEGQIAGWINPNGPIYFITHGFLESGKAKWIERMMNALLNRDRNATVIVIDWGKGSNPPYNQACANIWLVGVITAHIIDKIKNVLELPKLDRVHMIGHSLGAHLCGYTGQALNDQFQTQKLGRITGLDPAGLAFTDTDRLVRLDPSDAQFVDIVHTDLTPIIPGQTARLGLPEPIGHVNFYPNGGSDQPGCRQEFWENAADARFVSDMFQLLSCSNSRAYEYFTESLAGQRPLLVAVSCTDYTQYLLGNCSDCASSPHGCIRFGLDSVQDYQTQREELDDDDDDVPIQLFFRTASRSPFLQPNYRLTVQLSNSTASRQQGPKVGRIVLQLRSSNGSHSEKVSFNDNVIIFEPGHQYNSVVMVTWPGGPDGRHKSYDVARTSKVAVSWEYETSLLNPLSWCLIVTVASPNRPGTPSSETGGRQAVTNPINSTTRDSTMLMTPNAPGNATARRAARRATSNGPFTDSDRSAEPAF